MSVQVSDKVLKTLMALKALAERGEGGEKEKAHALFNKLLGKHGLTLEDLEIKDLKWQWFKVKIYQRTFFNYIVDNVIGENWEQRQHETKKSEYCVFCTNLDAIEIEGKFEFYWRVFQNDIPDFMKAFFRENKLFPKDADYSRDMSDLSEREREEMKKLFRLQELATRAEYRKQLKGAEKHDELK